MVSQSYALHLTTFLYLLLSNTTKLKFPIILKCQRIVQTSVIIPLCLGKKNGKHKAECGVNLAQLCSACLRRIERVCPGLLCNHWKLTGLSKGELPLPKTPLICQKFCSLSYTYGKSCIMLSVRKNETWNTCHRSNCLCNLL